LTNVPTYGHTACDEDGSQDVMKLISAALKSTDSINTDNLLLQD